MRLTEILKPQNILVPLHATVKSGAIAELVDLLKANGEVNDAKKLVNITMEFDQGKPFYVRRIERRLG